MNDNIYVYIVDLPPKVHEIVLPCFTGYTIYLDEKDSYEERLTAYNHALCHIKNHDFEKSDVNEIESEAHRNDIDF
jgi:hypothetical protein